MRILRVISSMDPKWGGPCQGLRNAIPEWDKKGYTTDVLSLDDPSAEFLKTEQLNVIAIGPAKTSWQYCPKMLPWLMRHLKDYQVVVVHGLWQYHGFAVNKAVKNLKKSGQPVPRLFVMPHGMLDPYFQQAEGRRLKALRNRIYWALIESDLIRNAEAVLFTCAEEMALASQTFRGYRPVDELNAGYGIARPPAASEQLQSAFRQQAGLDASTPFILFLSRIHPKKGADNLIDAYSKVYRRRLDEGKAIPMLVVAGPGMESEFGRSLRRKVDADSFLGSHVRFPGMLSGDAKWGAFYGSEVFILPSHQENFGIAVVEALACGKAVLISSKVNIFREIQDAGAGIVHSDDLDGCIRLLNDWLRMNASQRDEMQSRAAQLYEEVFTVARAAEQMRDVMGI